MKEVCVCVCVCGGGVEEVRGGRRLRRRRVGVMGRERGRGSVIVLWCMGM